MVFKQQKLTPHDSGGCKSKAKSPVIQNVARACSYTVAFLLRPAGQEAQGSFLGLFHERLHPLTSPPPQAPLPVPLPGGEDFSIQILCGHDPSNVAPFGFSHCFALWKGTEVLLSRGSWEPSERRLRAAWPPAGHTTSSPSQEFRCYGNAHSSQVGERTVGRKHPETPGDRRRSSSCTTLRGLSSFKRKTFFFRKKDKVCFQMLLSLLAANS